MTLTLTPADIRRLVRGVAKIIPARGSALPVLDQVRFRRIGDSDAEAAAVSPDETLTLTLAGAAAADAGPDAFLCPYAELRSLQKSLGSGDRVVMTALPGEPPRLDLTLQTGGRGILSRLDLMPAAEFPDPGLPAAGVPVDAGVFLDAYRTALPFVSRDPSRANLGGVFWDEAEHALVGTDGRRLTLLRLPRFSLGRDVILPPSRLLADGILEGGDGSIAITGGDGNPEFIELRLGSWRWRGRCREGRYPDYRMVIPAESAPYQAGVSVAAKDVALVRSAVSRLSTPAAPAVVLAGLPGQAPVLAAAVRRDDGGRSHAVLASSTVSAASAFAQAVNGRYLLDCLEAGFLDLRIGGDGEPWLCRGVRPGLHCLMPMRESVGSPEDLIAEFSEGAETVTIAQNITQPDPVDAAAT